MSGVRRFEDLRAWMAAADLVAFVFDATESPAFRRVPVLADQMRRSALSIPANIAEGFERYGDREFLRFLTIARSSAAELRSHIHIARRIGCLSEQEAHELVSRTTETAKIISGLMSHLRTKPPSKER